MIEIRIYSRLDFDEQVLYPDPTTESIISVVDPSPYMSGGPGSNGLGSWPYAESASVCCLSFADIIAESGPTVMTDSDAEKILKFVVSRHETTQVWHIHCSAGMSRSYTIGRFIEYYLRSQEIRSRVVSVSVPGHENCTIKNKLHKILRKYENDKIEDPGASDGRS